MQDGLDDGLVGEVLIALLFVFVEDGFTDRGLVVSPELCSLHYIQFGYAAFEGGADNVLREAVDAGAIVQLSGHRLLSFFVEVGCEQWTDEAVERRVVGMVVVAGEGFFGDVGVGGDGAVGGYKIVRACEQEWGVGVGEFGDVDAYECEPVGAVGACGLFANYEQPGIVRAR